MKRSINNINLIGKHNKKAYLHKMEPTYASTDVLQNYKEVLFIDLMSFKNPAVNSASFFNRIRKGSLYTNLRKKIDSLSQSERGELIKIFIENKPKGKSIGDISSSFDRIEKLTSERYKDLFEKIKRTYNPSQNEYRELFKDSLTNLGTNLCSIQDGLSKRILEADDIEGFMLIGQMLDLSSRIIEYLITELKRQKSFDTDTKALFALLFFLVLELELYRQERVKKDNLYNLLSLVSPFVHAVGINPKTDGIPLGVYSILNA